MSLPPPGRPVKRMSALLRNSARTRHGREMPEPRRPGRCSGAASAERADGSQRVHPGRLRDSCGRTRLVQRFAAKRPRLSSMVKPLRARAGPLARQCGHRRPCLRQQMPDLSTRRHLPNAPPSNIVAFRWSSSRLTGGHASGSAQARMSIRSHRNLATKQSDSVHDHVAPNPPSTCKIWPVTKLAASDASHNTAFATSSG